MITLRNFTYKDAKNLQTHFYQSLSISEIQTMISEWNQKKVDDKYFEMLAIVCNNQQVVGNVSLYEKSKSMISCGIRVAEPYQRQGYAKKALKQALQIAADKGYKIALHQVHADNMASVLLHDALQFETDGYLYHNRKGNEVLLYIKNIAP